ncbi:MAG: GNAT family protein [Chloroflexota bacterium]
MKIHGKQLNLRDFEHQDLPIIEHWLHPDHEWHKFDGPYYPKAQPEQIPSHIERYAKRINAGNWDNPRGRLAIADGDDVIIGMVTRYWISEETNWTAIGISIWNPEHWGKGYGYESLGMWCQYLFDAEPKFVRLDARTWSGNLGMMKLAEKLGFTQEARFRMARIVNGDYYDGLGYGILRDEWQARYPEGFVKSLR